MTDVTRSTHSNINPCNNRKLPDNRYAKGLKAHTGKNAPIPKNRNPRNRAMDENKIRKGFKIKKESGWGN